MDDLSDKIGELFSNPESLDKIKSLFGMLTDSGGSETKEHKGVDSESMPFDTDMLMKMQKALSLIKKDDPRVTFLLALKPNISEGRRKKVDEAIHLMRLVNLIPLLQDGTFL